MIIDFFHEQSKFYNSWFPKLILTIWFLFVLENVPLLFIHPFSSFEFNWIFKLMSLLELLAYLLVVIYSFYIFYKFVNQPILKILLLLINFIGISILIFLLTYNIFFPTAISDFLDGVMLYLGIDYALWIPLMIIFFIQFLISLIFFKVLKQSTKFNFNINILFFAQASLFLFPAAINILWIVFTNLYSG